MGGEGGGAGEERADDEEGGVHVSECGEGEHDGASGADDGVDGVPEGVEPGDFIGEEFDGEHDGGGGDDPGVSESGEVGVGAGEFDPVESNSQTCDEGGEVEVDPGEGGEAEGDAKLVEQAHGWLFSRVRGGGPFEIGGVIPTEVGEWIEMAGFGGAYVAEL